MNLKLRPGRRKGVSTTRETILVAARAEFAAKGFDATTLRQIALGAGVDVAMIAHHFGTKEKLFMAVLDVPLDPREQVEAVLAGPSEAIGERLLATFLGVWDSPAGTAAAALLRTAIQHDWSARLLRDFLLARGLAPIVASLRLPPDEAHWRTGLVATQLMGLVMSRYIFRIEAMANASRADLIAAIGPMLQHALTGPMHLPDEGKHCP